MGVMHEAARANGSRVPAIRLITGAVRHFWAERVSQRDRPAGEQTLAAPRK